MDNQTTIGRLFGEDMITFVIPSYQRAYSWRVGKDGRVGQVDMFLNDIIDQLIIRAIFLVIIFLKKLKEIDMS